ncbi:MAG: ribonucleotide reductase subunit alpha, partial [Stutzerimonas sp.]
MPCSFDHLLHAARQQTEPQRLLFVFAVAELPDDASAAERER